MQRRKLIVLMCGLAATGSLTSLYAGTNGFLVPTFRGTPGAEAGYWEIFSVASGAPGNTPDRPGSNMDAVLTQTDPGGFLTGSGNIYNPGGISAFTLAHTTTAPVGTVVLQIRTLGSELDYDSFVLTHEGAGGQEQVASLPRVELDRTSQPGLGDLVSSLWQWDLSDMGVTNYTLAFNAAGTSLSLDSITLDTAPLFQPLFTPPFALNDASPAIERWMYPHNAAPCDRPAGATFGAFGDEAGVDTRFAQHLVGFETTGSLPAGLGPERYAVERCRVTLTINRGGLFEYDPTQDGVLTYLATNDPGRVEDLDAGRPIELFGVGYRNGYDAATFDQCAPLGSAAPGERNAHAIGMATSGAWVDVSNNVGKTNEAFPVFEVAPFAIGQTEQAAAGQLVPTGARVTFDLDLANPRVRAYVQEALDSGQVRFMVTSLHESGGQFGAPSYPDFATRFNEAVFEPTRLEVEGRVLSDTDLDDDGLADDWEVQFLHTLAATGAADSDGDGSPNQDELKAGTDPLDGGSAFQVVSIGRPAEGATELVFQPAAGGETVIEYTEDWAVWSVLTNAPTYDLWTGQGRVVDDGAEGAKRFYRLRADEE